MVRAKISSYGNPHLLFLATPLTDLSKMTIIEHSLSAKKMCLKKKAPGRRFRKAKFPVDISLSAAEIMMCNFIAMYNLPFVAADHLSSLFSSMFPDSAIAADCACKHAKTTAIVCETLEEDHT